MNVLNEEPLPIEAWSKHMAATIDRITQLGREMLDVHRQAGARAAEIADEWRLDERLDDEHVALQRLLVDSRDAIVAIETSRQLATAPAVTESELFESLKDCAATIEKKLPEIEKAFLVSRQSALDLLRWTRREGRLEGSQLPDQYRAAYSELLAYTPIFKPRLDGVQQHLLSLTKENATVHSSILLLLTALTRYNAVLETARRFVQSVVDPPLELVFHDTQSFHTDWNQYGQEQQNRVATEVNDCCQLLLYDASEFYRRATSIRPALPDGVDASLYVLPVDQLRIVLSVDEDPVFKELIVTLLRVVDVNEFDVARDAIIEALYRDLLGD